MNYLLCIILAICFFILCLSTRFLKIIGYLVLILTTMLTLSFLITGSFEKCSQLLTVIDMYVVNIGTKVLKNITRVFNLL